ncbi:hypothetical protein DHW03_08125 [Pedobacter yonginense]|uniref:CAAX prenyl protease 2/Lysostaphin resistance protein A-like domain-containing protein n=1 Tax=Pedobacter yonginense TaxID=651869 RepID=A0A317EL25_9SPHI|nr:CPBP family glutamic-type intramembrane protease [Pedobacter yonginense]PWS27550.1 hypothetical protein DHW03_08125 [Pedobacter yonginense]
MFFIVVAPIAEELIFRLPLKVKRLNIFVALVMAYGIFYLSHKSVATLFSLAEVLKAITFILICLEILYCLKDEFFNAISTRYFSLYFYALTITFGLLHVRNYIDLVPSNLVLLAPIFAIPQIIAGFFLGYFRLKRGLFWSILLHAVINTPTTLFYFVKH